ncbi:MAG: TolC family protein [bacterium]
MHFSPCTINLIITLLFIFITAQVVYSSNIDDLIKQLDEAFPEPVQYTLDDCIKATLTANKKLMEKWAGLENIDGQKLVDLARFRTHLEFAGEFGRNKGSMLKTYYPVLNPPPISSAGAADITGFGLGTAAPADIESIAGMSTDEIAQLAAQYGIDISQFLRRVESPRGRSPKRTGGQEIGGVDISQCIDYACILAGGDVNTCIDFNCVLTLLGGSAVPEIPTTDNEFSMRLSRRLWEFGADASSAVTVRSNLRLALYNYEQTRRDVVSEVRKSFFLILLKQEQIKTRQSLLAEYEDKYAKLQKRFEVAQDVPRIDVLTAELDVLNEKLRINTLTTDLINLKMQLLQYMGISSTAAHISFAGEIQPFSYTLAEIVRTAKDYSYQIAYLSGQVKEQQRELDEVAWNYRPTLTGRIGIENRRTALGFSLSQSGGTYGVDLGLEQYLNLPSPTVGYSGSENHFNIGFSLIYPMHKGTERKGIRAQELANLRQLKAQLADQEEQIELAARQAYQEYLEALERLKLQGETVKISKRRLEITRILREHGKVAEFQLDSYRNTFFVDQDRLFQEQENVITAQENLRKIMGKFE